TGSQVAYNASVVGTPPWLFCSASGTTTGSVQVAVDPGTLAPGEYQGTVLVSSPGLSDVAPVQVILTVSAAPVLSAQPAQLNFNYQVGGQVPVGQTLLVLSNIGSVNITHNEVPFSGGNWLTVTGSGSTPVPFLVTVNPAGLTPGTYREQIVLRSADPAIAPV